MYQFTSFDTEEFNDAIEAGDCRKIKSFIVSAVRNNPCFKKVPGQNASEVGLAVGILDERMADIFEDYVILEGEHPFDERESDTWDKEYFIRQTFLLEENFSKQRLDHLHRIGKKVLNFREPQGQKTMTGKGSRPGIEPADHRGRPQNRRQAVGIILLSAVLVGIMAIGIIAINLIK